MHFTAPPPVVKLRPYQLAAIDRARDHIRRGTRRVLLVLPTGGGKTIIAVAIIVGALARGKRVVFFAHRRELIQQTRNKLIEAGVPADAIGILMGAESENLGAPVIVASVQTWIRRDPPPADLVFIDEAHQACSASYRALIDRYGATGATIIGLTATPMRADGQGLGDVFDALEVIAYPSELIADGYLVKPKVYSVPDEMLPDLRGVRTIGGDYDEGQLAERVNTAKLVGDMVATWRKRAPGLRTVVFAASIAHSKHVTSTFCDAGVAAEHIDGTTPTAERDAILARLASGKTQVVSNCAVLTEGWDSPSVKCCILARPTKNLRLYVQMAGRILRPWEGVGAILLDHSGAAQVLGYPHSDREYTLEMTREKREKQAPKLKLCPSCHALNPPQVQACQECGYEFVSREAPEVIGTAELREMTAPAKRLDRTATEEYKTAFTKLVSDWQSENARRTARGYRPLPRAAIYARFHERFGRKPPRGCVAPPELNATDEQKQTTLEKLTAIALERRYPMRWVFQKYMESYGHEPPTGQGSWCS